MTTTTNEAPEQPLQPTTVEPAIPEAPKYKIEDFDRRTELGPPRVADHVWLEPGDVFELDGGREYIIKMVNDCRGEAVPLNRVAKEFEDADGNKRHIVVTQRTINISNNVAESFIKERRGLSGLIDFLTGKRTPRTGEATGQQQNESENSMAKEKKAARGGLAAVAKEAKRTGGTKKKAATSADGANSRGALGTLGGFSVTGSIRTMGKEGFNNDEIIAALKANGIEAAPATVQIQKRRGVNGEEGAALSKEQIATLKEGKKLKGEQAKAPDEATATA